MKQKCTNYRLEFLKINRIKPKYGICRDTLYCKLTKYYGTMLDTSF